MTEENTNDVSGQAAEILRSFVERVERLEEEKKEINDQKKDVLSEAKSAGFEPKIIRKIVSMRKKHRAEIEEEQALLDMYMSALGM
jgi:uncharacterized protein (UPF0335 family)